MPNPNRSLPIPENERERLSALKRYEILNTLSEVEFDRITELASIICDTPISLVSFIDENRQWFKSKIGIEINETPREIAFCQYTIMQDVLLEIKDTLQDDRFKDNELVTGTTGIRFYAGIPLTDPSGYNLGTLCVIDHKPGSLTAAQKRALTLLSQEVIALIVNRRQKEELKNFESLFELSPDLICIAGFDGSISRVNPALQQLVNLNMDELIGKSFYDFIHPDDLEATKQEIATLGSTGKILNLIIRLRSAQQGYRSVQWGVSPEEGTGNLFAVGRDLTEELERELRLKDSEAKLSAFFENSQGLMSTHDLDGKFLSVNFAGAAMLGYTTQEILSKTLFDLVPKQYHDELKLYLEQISTTGAAKGQVKMQHKDGSSRIWMFNNILERSASGQLYIIGNAIDITERYELEKSLWGTKKMLEETNQVARIGGWQIDLQTQKIYWTSVTREIHGMPADFEPDLHTGINFYKDGESKAEINSAVNKALLDGSPWDLELQIVDKLGNDIWVRTIGKAEMKDGACQRLYGTFQDINEKKKAQIEINKSKAVLSALVEQLKAAKIQADEGSLAKSEFLANMSHEIRTPLNGVIGFTDLVLKTNLTDTQQQYLTIVNQSANALLGIINDILDFSKIEAGKLELDIEQVDLFELCAQATDLITYQVQNKGLEMLLNLRPNLPRFIWTDSVRLKQILVNLLSNAAKFTESGEIELKIEELSGDEEQSCIRFSVRDTGIGIKLEKQDKIFEAFSQADGSTTKKYGGTGLGLTISNKLLGMMDSRLELQSKPGSGSTFSFDISTKSVKGEQINWENLEEIREVLIVDDNDNNREIISQMLLLKNIRTTAAKNGFDALNLLASGKQFDVILMDYHMPYMNGLQTIAKIRGLFYATKEEQQIILLSSSSDIETVARDSETLQISRKLVKPIKMQDIYTALSQLNQKTWAQATIPVQEKTLSTDNDFTILIAEDNAINMLLAVTILSRITPNAKLIQVTNGLEAVEYCQKHWPNLILMDMQMPEMNGLEATVAIRSMEHTFGHIPIVALTAGNIKEEREKCLASGMDDFIVKPIAEETLARTLDKWLRF